MADNKVDIIRPEQANSLYGLFLERVSRSPDRLAFRDYDRQEKSWKDTNWQEMSRITGRWQNALARESLEPGDRVAIAMENSLEWKAFDLAALGLGLVTVPLYVDDRADNLAYVLKNSGARLLLIQDTRMWDRIAVVIQGNTGLVRILIQDGLSDNMHQDDRLMSVKDWLSDESALVRDECNQSTLASLVYTSGTTGPPKGVMLSHSNMLSNAYAGLQNVTVYASDIFLSFLPLSHTFERTVGYYLPIMTGSTVAHSRGVNYIADDLQAIRPTALISVPRIYERVYTRIMLQMEKDGGLKKSLFDQTVRAGWKRFLYQQGRGGLSPHMLTWPLLNQLVAKKVMDRMGGRVRVAICGGAALPFEVGKIFIALGLKLLQGYGLTEHSPVAAVNKVDNNIPESIGIPLQGVEVALGDKDELLLRSPSVMLGYWQNEKATREAIDSDGWLHTGDRARMEDEHVYITGRLKDIIVMSSGENISPADMEVAIEIDPLFEQVMIIGDGRAYLCALVIFNEDLWPDFARDRGLDPDDPESFRDPDLGKWLQKRLSELLKDFPGYAKVRRVTALPEPWTIENGLLTATMKLKRAAVVERFRDEIESMYAAEKRG